MFDGTPDESLPVEDQVWAISKLEEFTYRKLFHLSKRQMAIEPLEDISVNLKINQLVIKKQSQDLAKSSQEADR